MKTVKYGLCILVLMLRIVPAFAQESEEDMLRDLGMMGDYALGDLALNDIKRQNDPLLQLRRFFVEAKLPLTSAEERQLKTNIEATMKGLQSAKNDTDIRRANQAFTRNLFAALNPEQQTALRRYMNEQIMLRGGFPALKLLLENAQTPLTEDQQSQIIPLYKQFNDQADQLARQGNGNADKDQLEKLENQTLGNVVKILTPNQRKSLTAARLRNLNSTGKRPRN
jgi:hypothetical protein